MEERYAALEQATRLLGLGPGLWYSKVDASNADGLNLWGKDFHRLFASDVDEGYVVHAATR